MDEGLPRVGDVIGGKYRLDAIIGAGGMGVVMGAFDTSLGRAVAIKFLAPGKSKRPGATERFVREARAAASLETEHVVRVYEVGTLEGGSPFIVMEYLRGGDLAQHLASRGALPIEEAVDYLIQVTEALAEAHGRGIVHRDLKPQNLFLTTSLDGTPCVKVVDFGISKAAADSSSSNLTATDVVMGTPLYMSPEQVRSLKSVDHRSDIWALGTILFELVTATPVWDAPTASALCAAIAMDEPTPLRARRTDAPEALEAVILKCLAKKPEGRYPDVASLANALVPFATERGRASAGRASRLVLSGNERLARSGEVVVNAPGDTDPTGPTIQGSDPLAPTVQGSPAMMPSRIPPGGSVPAPAPLVSNRPPGTTNDGWQTTQGGARPGRTRAIVAGGLFGLAVLGAGGIAMQRYRAKPVVTAPVSLTVTQPSSAPEPSAGGARPEPSATPSASTSASASASTATAIAPKPAARDAGVAKPAVDEGQKRLAEDRCRAARMALTTAPQREQGARTAKNWVCGIAWTKSAARCERDLCRQACSILETTDPDCKRLLDSVETNDRYNPPPF